MKKPSFEPRSEGGEHDVKGLEYTSLQRRHCIGMGIGMSMSMSMSMSMGIRVIGRPSPKDIDIRPPTMAQYDAIRVERHEAFTQERFFTT